MAARPGTPAGQAARRAPDPAARAPLSRSQAVRQVWRFCRNFNLGMRMCSLIQQRACGTPGVVCKEVHTMPVQNGEVALPDMKVSACGGRILVPVQGR